LPGRAWQWCIAVLAGAQTAEQFGRQFQVLVLHLWLGLDLCCMVQRQAGHREQEHADQADRRADPVPLVQGTQPEAAALLLHGGRCGTAHGTVRDG